MSEQQVQNVLTPVSAATVRDAIATVWPSVFSLPFSAPAVLILVAQSALETGNWASMHNWNFGNLMHSAGDGHDYIVVTAYNGATKRLRAYGSMQDGLVEWLRLIGREPGAMVSAVADDLSGFVSGLKAGNYFEESVAQYLPALQNRYNQIVKAIGSGWNVPSTGTLPEEPVWPKVIAGLGTVVATVAGLRFLARLVFSSHARARSR